jgi:hypothetical protein
MQLWQLDIVGGIRLADGSELKLVGGVDDHSRYCVIATLVARATGRAVGAAFAAALQRIGVPSRSSPTMDASSPAASASPARPRCCSTGSAARTPSPTGSPGSAVRPPPARSSASTRPCGSSCWPPCHRSPAWRWPRRSSTSGSPPTTASALIRRWVCALRPNASTPLPQPATTACRCGRPPNSDRRRPPRWDRWSRTYRADLRESRPGRPPAVAGSPPRRPQVSL